MRFAIVIAALVTILLAACEQPSAPRATQSPAFSAQSLIGCVSLPSRCGYPDATNTGVPAGTTMRRVPPEVTSGPGWQWDNRGWLAVTSDGAVVENLIVSGSIDVYGTNVTIRNNRSLVTGDIWAIALRHTVNATAANNEIGVLGSTRLGVAIKDIYGDATGSKILRNDIVNVGTGIQWVRASSKGTTSTTRASTPGITSTA
jgi:hypothetical protein